MKRLALFFLMPLITLSAAVAAPLSSGDLQARFGGSEVRMSIAGFYNHMEDHLWRFYPDGRVEGELHYARSVAYGLYYVEKHDTGTWRVRGQRVCVEWNEFFWHQGNTVCFRVVEQYGSDVTLITDHGARWSARLDPWRR